MAYFARAAKNVTYDVRLVLAALHVDLVVSTALRLAKVDSGACIRLDFAAEDLDAVVDTLDAVVLILLNNVLEQVNSARIILKRAFEHIAGLIHASRRWSEQE